MARCPGRKISAAAEGTQPAAKHETGRVSGGDAMTEIRSGSVRVLYRLVGVTLPRLYIFSIGKVRLLFIFG